MDIHTAQGLTRREVEDSRRRHGDNRFTGRPPRGFWRQYLDSFRDPIIRILLAALALNLLVALGRGGWAEPLGIAAAVFLSTFVSTLSEYGSERAFARLQAEAGARTCRVRRREGETDVPVGDVVVGDLVLLRPGETVPADGLLVEGAVQLDQSPLNGESAEVSKRPGGRGDPARWDPALPNVVLRGASVTGGRGVMLVRRVGDGTVYGSLARELQADSGDSPLKARLGKLAASLSRLGYTAAVLVALADLFHALVLENGFQWPAILAQLQDPAAVLASVFHAGLLALAVVVMAVPEGLPMMITVVLSSNMLRMKRDQVMVRRMVGIETAGSMNLLFTDKTGTLTRGRMTAAALVLPDGTACRSLDQVPSAELRRRLERVCRGCVEADGSGTDRAVLAFAGGRAEPVRWLLPFDSRNKCACAAAADGTLLWKGAPEVLLPRCSAWMDGAGRRHAGPPPSAARAVRELTGRAMRVLLLAEGRGGPDGPLTYLGLLGLRDDLRPGARDAVAEIRGAGIRLVMITGDNRETAAAVAREAGILDGDGEVLTSEQLGRLSDAQVRRLLPRLQVVARALPGDKSRLVRLAREAGLVAGMTGDGVNDAPALKLADVGFAMGSGTAVAKEAGDIVILDDDLASIARAVRYGRTIFHSIRKFLVFQLTMNLSAVGVSLVGPFIGIDTPVTVTQMLWVNLIMDTLGGLAFAGEPPLARYMNEPPKDRAEPILTAAMVRQILLTGGYTVALCTAFLRLSVFRSRFGYLDSPVAFLTAFFTLFIFCGICNAFNARTSRRNLLADLGHNPAFAAIFAAVAAIQVLLVYAGGAAFRTTPLPPADLLAAAALAATVLPFDLGRKCLRAGAAGKDPAAK